MVNVYYGMGEVQKALAHKAARSTQESDMRQESCIWYQKSSAAFLRIPEWLPITPNEFDSRDPKEIKARLSSCPEAAEDGR